MDYACPHCHELMRTDAASGQPPPMCPRCGGDIALGASHAPVPASPPAAPAAANAARSPAPARSLATFLQATPKAAARADEMPRPRAKAHGPGLQEDRMQASQPTLEGEAIAEASDRADLAPTDATHGPDQGAASTPGMRAEELEPAADDLSLDGTALTAPTAVDATEDQALPTQGDAPALAAAAVPAATTAHEPASTPSFTQPARDRAGSRTAPWQWAVLALLALTLALQVLLADRARLAADAQWRPLLTTLCGAFGCSLPSWHEPDAFTMLSRDVRPAPGSNGALLVQATFRNDARWSQAWPVMSLTLSDADGRTVGARAFVPSEYLDGEATASMLEPGQSAQIMLQVREPEASVVAFSFDFD